MNLRRKNILVTGGCGFVGSHLVERLLENDNQVTIVDNLSFGYIKNIEKHMEEPKLSFIKYDLLEPSGLRKIVGDNEVVFHLAANPSVQEGNLNLHFNQNIRSTFHLLDAMKDANVKLLVFASSSTVYGEPRSIPTSEQYGPLYPISFYGASKLACEGLVSAYCNYYGIDGAIVRLGNVIGPNMTRSVIIDLLRRLKEDPNSLKILGNGQQEKSYLYITDCINAILVILEQLKNRIDVFNVSSTDRITVREIAEIILHEKGMHNTKMNFVSQTEDGRGWKGDVNIMQLAIDKMRTLGWDPVYTSKMSVVKTIRHLMELSP